MALPTVGLAVAGLFLSQCAHAGGLVAPLAVLILTNPLVSAAIGLSLLGERVQGGPTGAVLALTGAALAARGIVLLLRPAPVPVALPTPVPAVVRPALRPEVMTAA